MMLRQVFWVLFLVGFANAMHAQNLQENSFLIRLKPQITAADFREKMALEMFSFHCVDKEFRLYKMVVSDAVQYEKVAERISTTGMCQTWQKLHLVTNRNATPNDPLYAQQKYLLTVHAPDVWAYGNNPVTRKGDTIVVAIVDSGMDTLHPDLQQNHWINHLEIPFNGIDEDSNGYTDDYYGWNGADSNARTYTSVTLDGHGTAIAGEIGAKGDNWTGVTGMHWNVKVMPIVCYAEKGSTDDIGVVRSMLYAFRMKKLYLQSAGKKGANIVALNTSIGIDFAFPADAPIWCALYDSLGAVGIISSGATSNANNNIDNTGDIPSTCPSRYLVVVSNTDADDNRINSGYSPVNVDMAAPGQNVYTTTLVRNPGPNGPYTSESGTSFAAPLVSGEIALIYQTVCDTFLSLSKSDPDSAGRLMKGWVMSGTDALSVLSGKCVTGGRMNAYKTWQAMNDWCNTHDRTYSTKSADITVVVMYPNPLQRGEALTLSLPPNGVSATCVVHDISGKELQLPVNETKNGTAIFDTQFLAPGSYFVHIRLGENHLVRKLLVY